MPVGLRGLVERWNAAAPAERANAHLYVTELTDTLGLPHPGPAGSDYSFEFPIRVTTRDGTETTNFADLFKKGCFVLEAKHSAPKADDDRLLRRAFGQALSYSAHLPGGPPPYLLVLDVGRTLLVWDRWSGSYSGYGSARRIDLRKLHERPEWAKLLRNIWEAPHREDTSAKAAQVTKEVAGELAELAAALERKGYEQERVARFLMRCVFSMFAEDIGLLPERQFEEAIGVGLRRPEDFPEVASELWRAMDEGRRFGLRKLLRFNGHFFREHDVLPLTRQELSVLDRAAKHDWALVEPSILGTLLTRALDPKERHRLGAQYTPREFVERVVRPTIEEPLREEWRLVQLEVLRLRQRGRKREPLAKLRKFHDYLCGLTFLDPACGSGNFLYVALVMVKRIEYEVFREIEDITGHPEFPVTEVGPWQFHGIEVRAWAREVAELTLWIGYHQFWHDRHGGVTPPEPVLRETETLDHRDAVLAWDEIVEDPERSRPDPTPRTTHPVTGELVPDPDAKIPYFVYKNPRPAEWPLADFIVGNPPYMGRGRQRTAFGDGYVDALRAAYPEVPDNADYVMYWWFRAAREVAEGRAQRAGLITTNTIRQRHNREIIADATYGGARIAWAVPDHPWVDEAGSAAVRVSMTVITAGPGAACLVEVDDGGTVLREVQVPQLGPDLSRDADISRAASQPLRASRGLSSQGFTLVGEGFRLTGEEAERLLAADVRHGEIVRPLISGRDLVTRPRGLYTIDFGLMDEDRARNYPLLYDYVRDRVKPARIANKRESYARYWWRFGETRSGLRTALRGLGRYVVTVETSKHRVFQFLPAATAAEHSVVCIALEDGFSLGVLSSEVHVTWALAAGGRLGMGNDPRYQKTLCFDAFPFPAPETELRARIAETAERLDQHRRTALERDEKVTITGMYNTVAKLRNGEALTRLERHVHESAACGVLLDLHDELDGLVAEAYGCSMERHET